MSYSLPPIRCGSCGNFFSTHNRYQQLREQLQEGVSKETAKELAKYQPEFRNAKIEIGRGEENRAFRPRLEKRGDKTVVIESDPFESLSLQRLVEEMRQGVSGSRASEIALNFLGITKICCRQSMLQQVQLPEGPYHYQEKYQPDTIIVQPSGEVIGDSTLFQQVGVLSAQSQMENKRKKSVLQLEKRGVRQKPVPARLHPLKRSVKANKKELDKRMTLL